MPLVKKPRKIIIISSPSRWGRATTSNHTSTSFKVLSKSLTTVKTSLHSRLLGGLQVSHPCTSTSSSTMSLGWVRSYHKLSPTSSWRKQWRFPSTILWSTITSKESQSLRTKILTTSKIKPRGNLPSKDRRPPSFHQIRSNFKPMEQHFTPLRFYINKVFNTIKDQSCMPTRNQSGTISHFSEQKNITPIMNVRNTRPSSAGSSGNIWKSSSNKPSQRVHLT